MPEGWKPGWARSTVFARHLADARDAFERGDFAATGKALSAAAVFAHGIAAEAFAADGEQPKGQVIRFPEPRP